MNPEVQVFKAVVDKAAQQFYNPEEIFYICTGYEAGSEEADAKGLYVADVGRLVGEVFHQLAVKNSETLLTNLGSALAIVGAHYHMAGHRKNPEEGA